MSNNPDTLTIKLDMAELFTDFLPKMAAQYMALSGAAKELNGTEFSLVADISGRVFSYTAKNGTDIVAKEGDLPNARVRVSISRQDMEKFVQMKNIDMLIGMQGALNRRNYDLISNYRGECEFVLEHGPGDHSTIKVVFNGASSPKALFRLSMESARALLGRQANPVQLFMSGAMKIEGDIAHAMAIQPLFS
jgi:hypothetical protein